MAPGTRNKDETRKSIHVFDLDDTLMRTEAKIRVQDGSGRESRSLAPSEFTTYTLRPGESFDFRDFGDVGILARGIVLKYTRDIIDTLTRRGTRSDFAILTARGDKKLHAPFLIRLFAALFGIRLKNSLIFNLSDERFLRHKEGVDLPEPFRGRRYAQLTIPERKALVIAQDLVKKGYNDVSLYDDSRENLDSFKVMRHAFPGLTYRPHFIDPTWRVRLEEFQSSGEKRKALIRGPDSARILLENHSVFRAHPEAGLSQLDARGKVSLASPGLALIREGPKYFLAKEG